jgi:hypothetical protein
MSRDVLASRLQALVPDRVPGLAVVVVGPEGIRDVDIDAVARMAIAS